MSSSFLERRLSAKIAAYQTLYECLETLCKLIAPFSPFLSDWLFLKLNQVTQCENLQSVHLADFPVYESELIQADLEERMQLAQDACSLLLSLRKKANIKVRQQLQKALIPLIDASVEGKIKAVEYHS